MFTIIQFAVKDIVGELLYWPLWWYTRGLFNVLKFCIDKIKNQEQRLGLLIWIKNIFTPMFGQHDWEGRIISFFVRSIQIIFRFLVLLIWGIIMFLLVIIWILLPIVTLYKLYMGLGILFI